MKEIGRTNDGGHIVEMNQSEYGEFKSLYSAVSGKGGLPDSQYDAGRVWEFDLSNVFHVIRAHYMQRFKVNEFRGLVEQLEEFLNK